MFKNIYLGRCLKFAVIAAVLFCIPVVFYIKDDTYTASWLIYIGSFLFCGVITVYALFFNKLRDGDADIPQMITASFITVIMGVIFTAILSFSLLLVLVPGYPINETVVNASTDTPTNAVHGKLNGLGFRLFVGALLINFFIGAFVGGLFPFYLKGNQTRQSGKTKPSNND